MKKFGKLAKGVASAMAFVLAFTVVFANGLTVHAAETKEIFSGGTNEAYESSDASWLMNADDSDVITVVYTCTDDTHAGWGVLGWGATVDDTWKDGPGLLASETDATATVTAKVTVGDLKKTLGIKDGSNVSYIKLGAWNGGKIESLSISGAGAASVGGSTAVGNTVEDTAKEESVNQTLPELTGDYLYVIDEAKTLTIWPGEYLQYWNPGTTIYLKIEMESNGGFGGCLGTSVNKWAWQMEEFSSDTGSTITANWFLTPISNNIQLQFWWMSGTQIGIKSIEVVKAVDYRVPQDFTAEEDSDDTETTVAVDLADVAVASGNVIFTGNGTSSNWGQAVSLYTPVWDGTFDVASLGTNDYIVVDYSSANAPELVLQDPWTKINPCYAENGVAIYSYADMLALYGDFAAAGAMHIGDTGADLTVTSVRIVDATQLGGKDSADTPEASSRVVSNYTCTIAKEHDYSNSNWLQYNFTLADYIKDLAVGETVKIKVAATGDSTVSGWYGYSFKVGTNTYDETSDNNCKWVQTNVENWDTENTTGELTITVPYDNLSVMVEAYGCDGSDAEVVLSFEIVE